MRGVVMHRDDQAVSPVIATVLLLAITVLLSS
ncbi:MAG: archaellin/type IV pilin N-terminal domain-containing protein, partial [Candidatus Poseidoniaceae archaeon]